MPSTSRKAASRRRGYRFPYIRFHGKYYPLIPLSLRKGRRIVKTLALLDSGASISVFRPEIAKALAIPARGRKGIRLGTASGGVDIGVAPVEVTVGDTSFRANLGFSANFATSLNILGREGFFRHFLVQFDEKARHVTLIPL